MNRSERPYVICHVIATLDGRISGDAFYAKAMEPVMAESWKIRDNHRCRGILAGTTTAAEIYAEGMKRPASGSADDQTGGSAEVQSGDPEEGAFAAEDFVAETDLKDYAITIDTEGILNWTKNYVDRPVQPKSHVIVVVTEETPGTYIEDLRRKGISYIFAGTGEVRENPGAGQEKADAIHIPLMLAKLKELFGIDRLMCCGGGKINWTLMQAGCLDELSLVIAPVAEGSREKSSVFDRSEFCTANETRAFALKEVRRLPGSGLWLRYERQ